MKALNALGSGVGIYWPVAATASLLLGEDDDQWTMEPLPSALNHECLDIMTGLLDRAWFLCL